MRILFFITLYIFTLLANAGDIGSVLAEQKHILDISDRCPADVLEKRDDSIDFIEKSCDSKAKQCFERCSNNDGEACYNLAFTLQETGGTESIRYSEALFLKACALGSVSACTNRAAGIQKIEGDKGLDCALRTYEKACELEDPWACTMLGFHLADGKGVEKDLQGALQVIQKSCLYGEQDPACRNALILKKQIETALENE